MLSTVHHFDFFDFSERMRLDISDNSHNIWQVIFSLQNKKVERCPLQFCLAKVKNVSEDT